MKVTVSPYDARWPEWFRRVRNALAAGLRAHGVQARIEHVGSTAVPGLAAKPVIDVDVIVAAGDVAAAIAALEHAGYRHRGDLGIADRHSLAAPDDEPRRNVYVVVDGSLALRNHLAVRDLLRNDPVLRDEYGRVKTELATRDFDETDGYTAAKSPILQRILQQAGLTADELETIAADNTDRTNDTDRTDDTHSTDNTNSTNETDSTNDTDSTDDTNSTNETDSTNDADNTNQTSNTDNENNTLR